MLAREFDGLSNPLRTEALLDKGGGDAHLLQVAKAQDDAVLAEVHLGQPKRFVTRAVSLVPAQPARDARRRDPQQAAGLRGRIETDPYQLFARSVHGCGLRSHW